ncbi:unnamed protein product [Prunus brigantina]
MYRNLAETCHRQRSKGISRPRRYYRKFVKDFGLISKPLTDMLRKDGFVWSTEAEKAFETLKDALTTTPILALPDFTKDFVIECDASNGGIGAILSQDRHPIAYLSKALSPKHRSLSVYDKEMMAVVRAVEHWRPYLLGRKFKILTDHQTIRYFLEQRITTTTQEKWLLKLLGYNYEIEYELEKITQDPMPCLVNMRHSVISEHTRECYALFDGLVLNPMSRSMWLLVIPVNATSTKLLSHPAYYSL